MMTQTTSKTFLSGLPAQMAAVDLAETLADVGYWDDQIQDDFWTDGFDSDRYFLDLVAIAAGHGVELTDVDAFDYDKWFWNLYQCTEKGLS